jgi:signal transduction histidine kinase/ligand-binding sensor domain-containing protein/DNA-binding response OmpR family regulator
MGVACKQTINFIVFFLLLVTAISGQPKCKVEYYSTEQGLSHQRVTAIIKDREGFMWFGSWDGINRFDGQKFVSFKSFPGDRSQLGNDRIDQIVEDESGHLWIQAYDGQVYRFDKKTEEFFPLSTVLHSERKEKVVFKNILAASNGLVWLQSVNEGIFCVPQTDLLQGRFQHYQKEATAPHRLPSYVVNFFHEDSNHRIWIGTPEGLCCLEKSASGNFINSKIIPSDIGSESNLTAFDEDAEQLYFGTVDGRLVIFQKNTNAFVIRKITTGHLNALSRSKKSNVLYAATSNGEVIIVNLAGQTLTTAKYRSAESLNTLYEDGTGALWIQPEKSGAIRFDPFTRSFQLFSFITGESLNYIGNRYRVLEDNTGTVWVNMKGGGFGYYNPATKKLEYVLPTPDGTNYNLPPIVYAIYYDNDGILWLTTNERDLVKIVLQGNSFKQQLLAAQGSTISDNEVRGIFYDNKDRLWIGAKRGNLFIYQNNILLKDLFINAPPEGLAGVYSILQDRRGNIWLGTKGNGLFKATPVNKEGTKYSLTHFLPDKNNPNSLPCNEIYALLEDNKGSIWMGAFDGGLSLIVDDGNSTSFIHGGHAFKNYPKEAFQKIRHMALDDEGNIWMGTTNGLLVQGGNNQQPVFQYKTYSKIPGDKESLGNNDIQFIYRDAKNRMWLATSGSGFSLAVGNQPLQSLRFRNYTTKDGMPNNYVLSCAEDKQGNIWLATENGLSKFNPETKVFRNYDSYDGLPKIAFSEASVCKNFSNGELVFGARHGYLTFNPEHINTNRIQANIAFTNLQINNEDVRPGMNDSVLKTDINYVSKLLLKYNQNIISIDYAILDHRAGSQQAFAYRLVGFDTLWHDDRQYRRATYTGLRPGHYVFEVKSLSTDLYSNQPYKRLAITILPPPWKTGWAYTLYAIIIGVLLYFIRRNALEKIRLRNNIAVEQKLAALKMNFFTNVSHELRTPLTLIVNPLEQLSKKGTLSSEEASWVDIARKNASRMVRFINQLLDLRKVQSDKAVLRISRVEMVTFVKKIMDHFTEAARSKRIKLEIEASQKELIAWVDAEKLDVVIYNLLGNALKFTPEGKAIKIFIKSIPEEQSFSISVQDQGRGVPKDKLEAIFELFQEGEPTNGRELKGTGIGLALSREFVNLHGGKIWAENNEEGGLTVTLKLKLGSEHYTGEEVSFVDLPKSTPVFEKPIGQQILPQLANTTLPQDQQAPLVLLVEDNDELRSFIKGQLSAFYRVETARDGEEGLQKAIHLIPDLIVSDIMMPKMDGIEMLDKVKSEVNTSHIPVVLLSAKYSIESQIEGLKYGADYYITKPFNNEFLIASIDNLLRQRKKLFEALVEKKKTVALSPEPVVITSKDEAFLKEVIKVVEEKMADTDFNIDAVAESMAMSHKTFYRKFKSLTGLTPVEFVRDMRLQRAKQLLDAGGYNISEVAYTVGFSNPGYFTTCFKEKYHVSPSDYAKTKKA